MTNASTGAAARLHALPALTMADPARPAPVDAPATSRTLAQVDALDEFVRHLTSNNGSGDAVHLRLLFGELHPDDRAIALQVLAPFRESTRRLLVEVATGPLDRNVDELRRQHVRLQEIGVKSDATAPTATTASSAVALDEFRRLLLAAAAVDGIGRPLRSAFARMTPDDRRIAQAELADVRRHELGRTQGILAAENGEIDPSQYNLLRRLANVDAPVEAWEVPSEPGAGYSFAAGM